MIEDPRIILAYSRSDTISNHNKYLRIKKIDLSSFRSENLRFINNIDYKMRVIHGQEHQR